MNSALFPRNHRLGALCAAILAFPSNSAIAQQETERDSWRRGLRFHASFDRGVDADVAAGDRRLWQSSSMEQRDAATPGLPEGGHVRWDTEGGYRGGCLRFTRSEGPLVFFKMPGNISEPREDWSGTVSLWLNTDPHIDLREGFCDPIQITSKQWNDAAMFVEFEKRASGIPFRLGVYADRSVWNPTNRKFEEIPPSQRPLVTVDRPPFAAGTWVHVLFVFEHFNTGNSSGRARLYLQGELAGELSPRVQTFTWDASQGAILLGLGYVGSLDELAIWDRALSDDEVREVKRAGEPSSR